MSLIDVIFFLAIIFIILFILKRQDWLQNEFLRLLKIVGSLKFHQFNHEAQLLERNGVYLPEDTALFVYNLLWNLVGENEQRDIQDDYKKNCASNIPFWKYFLYRYQIKCEFEAREPMDKYFSTSDIQISGLMESVRQSHLSLKAQIEEITEISEDMKKMKERVKDVKKQISSPTENSEKETNVLHID